VDTIREVDRPINPSRRDVLKTSGTLMIAALWGAGPVVTQDKEMTDTKKPNALPSVLTYDDVRAVSPALEHYTKGPLLDGLWKRPDLSPRDRSIITGLPSSHGSKRSRCHFTLRWHWITE